MIDSDVQNSAAPAKRSQVLNFRVDGGRTKAVSAIFLVSYLFVWGF
jgi:hypothetical protein